METFVLSADDQTQLRLKHIPLAQLQNQIEGFKQGYAPAQLVASAGVNKGINVCNTLELDRLTKKYDTLIQQCELLKFVPASGAATRMFKHLFTWREAMKAHLDQESLSLGGDPLNPSSAAAFGIALPKYAFYPALEKQMQAQGNSLDQCLQKEDYLSILEALLNKEGLNYAALPKALIAFHSYGSEQRCSLEEHLVEAAAYLVKEGLVSIHFTVSPEHLSLFKQKLAEKQALYEKRFNIKYHITYSIQKPSTDTIAVDLNNSIFRDSQGAMLFRPGGHGALIENLNDCKGDIIFIKNIDNVTIDALRADTIVYKKALAAILLELREQIFSYLSLLETATTLPCEKMDEIVKFASQKLNIVLPDLDTKSQIQKIKLVYNALNRPMRVCGMVKNEGEPGGGPFWVQNPNTKEISLQIVESSQINMQNEAQKAIFESATHFNPV
ncbi:MAG: DUF4301 family protein, partial [Bacteroidales bacterium]